MPVTGPCGFVSMLRELKFPNTFNPYVERCSSMTSHKHRRFELGYFLIFCRRRARLKLIPYGLVGTWAIVAVDVLAWH